MAVIAGAIAGSISLVGFGIDSFIEVTSGSVLLWRMSVDAEIERREVNLWKRLQQVDQCSQFQEQLLSSVGVMRTIAFVDGV